jgi:hypothetical protein
MFTCCFCAEVVTDRDAFVAVSPAVDESEVQALYCHPACLDERLHQSIPRHPTLLGE